MADKNSSSRPGARNLSRRKNSEPHDSMHVSMEYPAASSEVSKSFLIPPPSPLSSPRGERIIGKPRSKLRGIF